MTTWVLPLTFMIVMAWGCETHARELGRRTLALLRRRGSKRPRGDQGSPISEATTVTTSARSSVALALFLSVAIPIGFIAYVNHIRNTVGVNWLSALGALVALSMVIATAVISSRK